jgi:hypothetical protein
VGEKPNDSFNPIPMDRFTLDTKVGILHISLRSEVLYIYSIFTRFEDVEKAKKLDLIHFGEHSGKWNFHETNPVNITMDFKTEIENLLVAETA